MTSKRTKGPWCLQSQGTGDPLSIMGQDNTFICRLDEGSYEDAALLAAAPQLLQACQLCIPTLEQIVHDDPQNIAATLNLRTLRAAIVAAGGEK